MKKLLLSLLAFAPATSLVAEIQKDPVTKKFYSTPPSPDIDQEQYHQICMKIKSMLKQYVEAHAIDINDKKGLINNKTAVEAMAYMVVTYLTTINTPTSERFLIDWMKGGIFGFTK